MILLSFVSPVFSESFSNCILDVIWINLFQRRLEPDKFRQIVDEIIRTIVN